MVRVDVPKLAPEDVGFLLRDLCIRVGFCLSPADQAALCASPPMDVDSCTEAVFRAEDVDASPYSELWHQVRETVAQAYKVGGGATS